MESNKKIIFESITAIEQCSETLNKIAETCCSSDRSPNMIQLQTLFNEILSLLNNIDKNSDNIKVCIEHIATSGSQLGFLYVTCCTVVRAPLYQNIFSELMQIHCNMWRLSGHAH